MLTHPVRKSTRLVEYDYSSVGGYFITLVTYDRLHLFGEIIAGIMQSNPLGQIVAEEWLRSPMIRKEITLDEWCLMPNHFHAIVMINENGQSPAKKPDFKEKGQFQQTKSLGSFVAGFKSAVTKRINETRQTPGIPVWQRNYYDHIIRDEDDLDRIRNYIASNSLKWELDKEYSP
jgi:REP element-mobilizing transposase RayT